MMKKKHNQSGGRISRLNLFFWIFGSALIITTIVSIAIFKRQVRALSDLSSAGSQFRYNFAYIGDKSSSFQKAVYDYALSEAEKNGDYMEFTGKNLDTSYTIPQLMDLAIQSKVNGIIVNGDDSEDLKSAINHAVDAGIPVICVGTDCYGSGRQSFVGVSYYNVGEDYGDTLSSLANNRRQNVLVIASPEEKTTGQNLVISGIKNSLEKNHVLDRFSISSKTLGDGDRFSTAEAVTDLFESSSLPDILVCLDETTTSSVCQTIVDTNHVGDVTICGYYRNDTILNAVQRKVAAMTLTVSPEEIGRTAVDNLLQYIDTGFVTEYSPIDIEIITPDNVRKYLEKEEKS
ncbi:MAG: sugar ABC transporter substrate-binding protein [Bilifractor sp.]|nr:sugar ABC transporter substrate-binding protein [Lachnospiraceae bacterium]MDY2837010.1 sugar ABC transporter substrate-binding protein [Bilifractor sp.]